MKECNLVFPEVPPISPKFVRKLMIFSWKRRFPENQILSLGISLPGIVDPVQKMITYSHALGVRDLPFGEMQSYFPWHCTFLNDANAGAFAEGIGSDLPSSFFYLSLSNTVGGAHLSRW